MNLQHFFSLDRIRKFVQNISIVLFLFHISNVSYADNDKNNNKNDDDKKSYVQLIQEVFRTDLVYPQSKGEVQISFLPTFLKQRDQKNIIFPLAIEYGLTDAWQIEIFGDAFIIHYPNIGKRTTGAGDLGVGTKYSFMNICHSNYSVSLNLEVSFPTGDIEKELTEGFIVYEPSISIAKDFPDFHHSQLFGQVGFEFLKRVKKPTNNDGEEEVGFSPVGEEEIEPQAHTFFLNVGFFLPVGIARYVIEINWATNRWNHSGNDNELYLTPGIVLEPAKHWEIAAGASKGLNKTSDPYDIFLRATYEFDTI